MKLDQLPHWRSVLSDPVTQESLQYVLSLAPRPITERALKAREKFKTLSPDIMRLVLETARCREELTGRLPWAAEAFFLQSRVEQSTRPEIARHHAQQFRARTVLEIGCGIGFDTAALSSCADTVLAIDSDALCCAITEHNLRLQGIKNVSVRNCSFEEFKAERDLSDYNALWADPGRRTDSGDRIYDPEHYLPPLSSLTHLAFKGLLGIKISPALNVSLPSGEWCREFIGWEWNCPEQVLWCGGSLRTDQATLADKHISWAPANESSSVARPELLMPGSVLIEPHPALVRTGAVESFYSEHGFFQIDSQLALGITDLPPPPSAWYREFRIIENFRFNTKALKERLGALGWDSRTQIKKRGVQEDPDQLHRALKLPSPRSDSPWGFVILTRVENSPQAILAHRI